MPILPIPTETGLGADLPVSDATDVLGEFSPPHSLPDVAPVRDAIVAAYTEGYIEYQSQAERAAAQSDPLRATGSYLRGYAEEHEVVPAVGESETSLRARLFASPSIVTPDAIQDAIDAIIAPKKSYVSELDMDGWFLHASTTPSQWESFVGAPPNYPDRHYDLLPFTQLDGAVPTNNLPRSFHVRIPALQAQDLEIEYVGPGFFISGDQAIPDDNSFFFQNQQTSLDIYNAVIAKVDSIKGQGVSWSLVIDPSI